MADEPERTLDDTNPNRAINLDDRLRAEEPPVSADDTNPNRRTSVHEWLAANEPPIADSDTHPSQIVRQMLADEWPPRPRSGRVMQAFAALLLVGAFILVLLAAYIVMDVGESNASETPDDGLIAEGIPDHDGDTTRQDATTPTPATTPLPPVTDVPPPFTGADSVFPTAAADEIAAALRTPVAADPPADAIARRSAPFTIRLETGRSRVIQYTVREGDTLESIAESFGLNDHYTLIWSNSSNKYNPLRPGKQLNILPVDGVYHEVTDYMTIAELAEQYDIDPYTIIDAEYNDLFGSTPQTLLVKGMHIVIPGAEAERELFLPQRASSGGTAAGSISGTYILWGCTANVQGGTMPYGRPLANYTWMRGMTPGGHTGVDIAANPGDPIYASGSGTVVYAGWNSGGYGNVVVLAHGPVFTIYGHMTRTGVSCGQQVSAGSVIGTVGSTGNSSGPHLHFEVRDADFNVLDPQNWVGF